MNDDTGTRRSPRRVGVLAVVAGIAVLATACGGSGSPTTSTSTAGVSAKYQKALAYSQCMRSHGVSNFPDPNSSGGFTSSGGGSNGGGNPNTIAKASALTACRHLLPNGGTVTPAQQQQAFNQALKFSQCMRAHGLRDFPDPASGGGQAQLHLPSDINPQSPQFQSAQRACQSLQPSIAVQPGGAP